MRDNKSFTVLCCLVGLTLLFASYDTEHDNSLLGVFLLLASLIGWFLLVAWALYRVIKRTYLPWQKRLAPFYLVLAPFAILASWGIGNWLLNGGQDWLTVESYDFTGSDTMVFRKDGEYQYWGGSPLGRSAVVRGRYERRDSLLIILPADAATTPTIAKLAIRPYELFKHRQNSVVRLTALDSAGTKLAIFRIKERID